MSLDPSQSRPQFRPQRRGGMDAVATRVERIGGMTTADQLALQNLLAVARDARVGVIGEIAPDGLVRSIVERAGIVQSIRAEDIRQFEYWAVPMTGEKDCRKFQVGGVESAIDACIDLCGPHLKRVLSMLELRRAGTRRQPLILGGSDDAETRALACAAPGAMIIEDERDIARLAFSPEFLVIPHTRQAPRRTDWMIRQLRGRYRDSAFEVISSSSPELAALIAQVEKFLGWCDCMVVVGDPSESSSVALREVAQHGDRHVLTTASGQSASRLAARVVESGARRVLVVGGQFVLRERLAQISEAVTTALSAHSPHSQTNADAA